MTQPGIESDPLTRMFTWWNGAYRDPDGFTEAGFARFFAPDAAMTINGEVRAVGLAGLVERFRAVQAGTRHVEIELPFGAAFASADGRLHYTRHRVLFAGEDGAGVELVAGHAIIEDGLIRKLDFISAVAAVAADGDEGEQG